MNKLTECPIDQLQAYLDDTLDEPTQTQLVIHLDECESCRQRIERNAGSIQDWQEAKSALASCKLDAKGNIIDEHTLADSLRKAPAIDPLSLLQLLAPSDDPRAAGRIGPFEVTGIVGSGGMGLVLKAHDPALDRFVAIKILAPHLARSQSARKRFAREARAAAAVIHDNVIAIYQVAEWNELPYLVMPYMPDPSLQQRIDDHGRLDLESTLSIGMQVARGLAAAHSQGLVHRDVKPANILLAKGTERAIITDFGLARAADDASLTRIGLLAGTPHYMSPEQARGEAVDQKSDLFSLGSLLFAMITGEPPIAHELGSETIQKIAAGKVPSLNSQDVPQWLSKLVDWLHAPRPLDRPESASQVAQWLEQCLAHQRQPDAQPLPECLLPTHKPTRRAPALVIASCLCAAALLAAAYPLILAFQQPDRNNSASEQVVSSPEISNEPIRSQPPVASIQTDAPKSRDWLGDQVTFDAIADQSTALQASIDQTWKLMPEAQLPEAQIPDAQTPNPSPSSTDPNDR